MTEPSPGQPFVMPCGCVMTEDGEGTLFFEPHSLTCEYYLYFVQEATEQGKEPITLDMR